MRLQEADTVAQLLKHGADPAAKDAEGLTPLDYAEHRSAELVNLLQAALRDRQR